MLKCFTIILLEKFSFVTFSPVLASLNSSGGENKGDRPQNGFHMNIVFVSFYTIGRTLGRIISLNKLVEISSELFIFISFLELASNFWVDELQEISSDVVALKTMSQLLVFLFFFLKLLRLRKKLFISRSLPDRFSWRPSFQRCSFFCSSYQ